MTKVVLITRCSTGIGRDLALRLTQSGYAVVATARKMETLADLPVVLKLPLDVTQPDSIARAVDCVLQQFGRIDVLVNNAGYAVRGAVEEICVEHAQKTFDVNVFGVMRMIRAVAPQMRKQKTGCIVNLSSIAGKLATPANGVYAATKFALEALNDAMRMELAPFGIAVVLIEPGPIKTNFLQTVESAAQGIFSNPYSPYQPLYHQYRQVDAALTRDAPSPQIVSQVIQRAIETAKPKARYLAGVALPGKLILGLRDLVWDGVVRQLFKIKSLHAN